MKIKMINNNDAFYDSNYNNNNTIIKKTESIKIIQQNN